MMHEAVSIFNLEDRIEAVNYDTSTMVEIEEELGKWRAIEKGSHKDIEI